VGIVLPPLPLFAATSRTVRRRSPIAQPVDALLDDEDAPVEWSEEDIVFLHWRLLQEVSHLADPATPLEEKFDTLRWVFSEREKDGLPFSFVSCLRVVGCSPLSPIAYCGRVDAEEVRDRIRHGLKAWLNATLERYPDWVRDAVVHNPDGSRPGSPRTPSGSTSKSSGWPCRATCSPDAVSHFSGWSPTRRPSPSRSRHDHFQGCPVPAGDLRRLRHRRTPGL
jgi:hypothetical protein